MADVDAAKVDVRVGPEHRIVFSASHELVLLIKYLWTAGVLCGLLASVVGFSVIEAVISAVRGSSLGSLLWMGLGTVAVFAVVFLRDTAQEGAHKRAGLIVSALVNLGALVGTHRCVSKGSKNANEEVENVSHQDQDQDQ